LLHRWVLQRIHARKRCDVRVGSTAEHPTSLGRCGANAAFSHKSNPTNLCDLVAYVARRMLPMEAEFRVTVATGEIMPRHKWSLASSRADAVLTCAFTALMIFAAFVGLASTIPFR
jgi:hypothetical protein